MFCSCILSSSLNDIKYIDMKLVCGHDRKVSEFYPVGERNFFGKCDDMVDTIGSCSKKAFTV